jgi:hypothetical protein
MSGSTSNGPWPNCEIDVMGQQRTTAPQQIAPWFDQQTAT